MNQPIPSQPAPHGSPAPAISSNRELAPYSRVRGGARYTQVAAGRKRKRRIALYVVVALVAAVLVGAGIAAASVVNFYNSIGQRLNAGVTEQTKAVLADQQASAIQLQSNWTDMSPFYMLLIGVDSDESRMYGDEAYLYGADDSLYRSDTMILTRVDPGNKKVTLVSIHRDTWYPIDGIYQKINNAFSIGGVAKTIEVISEFAGVPISHYASINIDGLFAIVDVLGGVEVDVPYDINDDFTGWTLSAGYQTLDGEDAMIFVRSRHAYDDLGDGDRYRAAHQRLFIAAVLQKLMASSPMDMVAVIDELANYVETDFSLDQVVNLALAMRGIDMENDVYSTMNPTLPTYENATWYEISQDSYWREIMRQVDAGERPDVDTAYRAVNNDFNSATYATSADLAPENVHIVVKNASGDPARAAQVIQTLQANGWTNVEDAGDTSFYLDTTAVVWESSAQASNADTVAGLLGTASEEAGLTWIMAGDVMVVVGAV